MSVAIGKILEMIDSFAPFETAEEWDNVGLLAGKKETKASNVLCALELNEAVLEEARNIKAELIVTHHPVMFRGRKNLCEDDPEGNLLCGLVRSGIGLIAAHTNFDNSPVGVNPELAGRLGLIDIEMGNEGIAVGILDHACSLREFACFVGERLNTPVRVYGRNDDQVKRVAVMGGAGGDYYSNAIAAGADTFVTGEVSHHKATDAYMLGIKVLEAGHAATETPAVHRMAEELRKLAGEAVAVFESDAVLF